MVRIFQNLMPYNSTYPKGEVCRSSGKGLIVRVF